MNAHRAYPSIHMGRLAAPDDFDDWRTTARALLASHVAPEHVQWSVADEAMPNLFATPAPSPVPTPDPNNAGVRIPRALLDLMRAALLHSDTTRFDLAYRILWRLNREPLLHSDPADPDMIALAKLAKSVRRDIHKMHAFVRFRKVVGEIDDAAGRESFAAWFEPDHHIGRAVAGFFRNRFTGINWLIVTPEVSIAWDGTTLREGPGGHPGDVPDADTVEAEWCAYYANIFNPARVKIAAMKREMPIRYWRNLPESRLIQPLLRDAGARVDAMVQHAPDKGGQMWGPAAQSPVPNRHFADIDALYAALRAEDEPPSAGFSNHNVPGEGPLQPRLMFVGEQPGEQEDRIGRPFIGPAGQLLDQCFAEAGIKRDSIFLTNAVKRFKFTVRGTQRLHATPTSGDIDHYRWWLAEEIRLVRPTVIVALGATALQSLSGRRQPLGPLRGEVLTGQDCPVLVTIHPSYLLRLGDQQARDIERGRLVRDLRKAMAMAA